MSTELWCWASRLKSAMVNRRAGSRNPEVGEKGQDCWLRTPVLSVPAQQPSSRWKVQPLVNSGPQAQGTSGAQVFGLHSGIPPASNGSHSPPPTSPPSALSQEHSGVVAFGGGSPGTNRPLSGS